MEAHGAELAAVVLVHVTQQRPAEAQHARVVEAVAAGGLGLGLGNSITILHLIATRTQPDSKVRLRGWG